MPSSPHENPRPEKGERAGQREPYSGMRSWIDRRTKDNEGALKSLPLSYLM